MQIGQVAILPFFPPNFSTIVLGISNTYFALILAITSEVSLFFACPHQSLHRPILLTCPNHNAPLAAVSSTSTSTYRMPTEPLPNLLRRDPTILRIFQPPLRFSPCQANLEFDRTSEPPSPFSSAGSRVLLFSPRHKIPCSPRDVPLL